MDDRIFWPNIVARKETCKFAPFLKPIHFLRPVHSLDKQLQNASNIA